MALIEALICYILYVVVLLYYQYYIGKCKCFTRAQLGKARAVIAALRGRVAHARARLCNETRNPAFVLPGRQHAAPLALLRLAASPWLRFAGAVVVGVSHMKRRQSARLALFSHAASRRSCWPGCSGGSRGAARSAPRLAAPPPRRGCASSVRWWWAWAT